jgi:hypothetical protein
MKRILLSCLLVIAALGFNSCNSDNISPGGGGQGGSMARFAIAGKYLYVVDTRKMHVFDLANPALPVKVGAITLGFDIETIFPYEDKLFIGSMTGMHIYSITDPAKPAFLSTYSHVTSCDPVVVQGNLAYVTLRSGTGCMRGVNQLEILDISNATQPTLVSTYQMSNPFGLGIDGTTLFVCEGAFGLKVLNVADPRNIQEIGRMEGVDAYDVIPRNKNLIMTGNNGVFQYNYSQPEQLTLNSKLSANGCK